MARRGGGSRHLKRIAVSKKVPITNKKEYTFMQKPLPGPHSLETSIPLGVLLRDVMHVVDTAKEAKKAILANKVFVDNKKRGIKFPVGFMDVVVVGDKCYRVWVDEKGRFKVEGDDRKNLKVLKIKRKVSVGKDKYQLTFHDGRTYLTSDNNFRVGDSVLFDLDKKEVVQHVKNKEGVNCIIAEGRHAGVRGKLAQIVVRAGVKEAIVETEKGQITTRHNYIFALPDGW